MQHHFENRTLRAGRGTSHYNTQLLRLCPEFRCCTLHSEYIYAIADPRNIKVCFWLNLMIFHELSTDISLCFPRIAVRCLKLTWRCCHHQRRHSQNSAVGIRRCLKQHGNDLTTASEHGPKRRGEVTSGSWSFWRNVDEHLENMWKSFHKLCKPTILPQCSHRPPIALAPWLECNWL